LILQYMFNNFNQVITSIYRQASVPISIFPPDFTLSFSALPH
jgi:hypothetical protein